MIILWNKASDMFFEWLAEYVGDRDYEFLAPLNQAAYGFLVGKDSPDNLYGKDYFKTGLENKQNETLFKMFDHALLGKEYEPSWDFEGNPAWTVTINPDNIEYAVKRLRFTGDFFYLHVLFLTYISGIDKEYLVSMALEENDALFKDIYQSLKVYVTAKKMEREFSKKDIDSARKVYKSLTPIPPDMLPPYAFRSASVFREEGNYYLTYDALKAISAAGGLAQALERQDLEGGVTNAATKQSRVRKTDTRTTENDEEDGAIKEDSK